MVISINCQMGFLGHWAVTIITLLQLSLTSAPDRPVVNLLLFAHKDIGGTYLLINGQVQALCKQHEPVHFTAQGEDKRKVAGMLGYFVDLCWFAKFHLPL